MATPISRHIYTNGTKRTTTPVALSSTFNVSQWHSPEETISVQSNLIYDDGSQGPLSVSQDVTLGSDVVIQPYEVVDMGNFTATNASQGLSIPNGQEPIHPRVLDMGASGWNGYRYWMAFTPYTSDTVENPSIVVSNEAPSETQAWVVPTGGSNPIFPTPATGYNSDAELVYDEANDLLWIVNRKDNTTGNNIFSVKSSSDGINWSSETVILTVNSTLLSPSIQWDGDRFRAWFIGGGGAYGTYNLYVSECTTMNGTWSTPVNKQNNVYNLPSGMWHISVNKVEERYHAFVYSNGNGNLYFSESLNFDELHFNSNGTPLLTPSESGWDSGKLYQSSGIILDNGNYGIYYSGGFLNPSQNIGFTEVAIPKIDTSLNSQVTNGLIGFFNMNEASGNPADSFGSMTATATPESREVAGKIGTAFKFNGGNLKITGTGIKSLQFWIKGDDFAATNFTYLIDTRTAGTAYFGKGLSSGMAKCEVNNIDKGTGAGVVGSLPKGNYINIYLEFSTAVTGEITLLSRYTNEDVVKASIDLLSVYNKSLSVAEKKQNYNYQIGIEI